MNILTDIANVTGPVFTDFGKESLLEAIHHNKYFYDIYRSLSYENGFISAPYQVITTITYVIRRTDPKLLHLHIMDRFPTNKKYFTSHNSISFPYTLSTFENISNTGDGTPTLLRT